VRIALAILGATFLILEVWAADGATSPSENRKRAVALACEASVFPLRVEARHWEKTGLVDVRRAELLPESNQLLRDYARDRPLEQDEDSIMRAVPNDSEGLIAVFCLVACKC
jgi:hypothetical protein